MSYRPFALPGLVSRRSDSRVAVEVIESRVLLSDTVLGQVVGLPAAPTSQPVEQVTVQFDQPVQGFDLADINLTATAENSANRVMLHFFPSVVLEAISPATYRISGLSSVLKSGAFFRFQMAADATITDAGGTAVAATLEGSYQSLWHLEAQAVGGSIYPNPRVTPVADLPVLFYTPHSYKVVTGFEASDLHLFKDGVEIPLGNDIETYAGRDPGYHYDIADLSPYNTEPGRYKLVLPKSSGIVGPGGETMINDLVWDWEIVDGGSYVTDRAATDDSYVRYGTYTNTNFGQSQTLETGWNTTANEARIAYVKFDLSGINPDAADARALLRLRARSVDGSFVGIYAIPTTGAWTENALTYSNRPVPPAGQNYPYAEVFGAAARIYDFNVTSYVRNAISAGQTSITFALPSMNTTNKYVIIDSDESGKGPKLRWIQNKDPVSPQVVLTPSSLVVPEGGSVTVSVSVSKQVVGEFGASIYWDLPEPSLSFTRPGVQTPGNFVFTRDNWNVPQTFVISAAEDADAVSSSASLWVNGKSVVVRELDNDPPPPPTSTDRTLRPSQDGYIRDGAYQYQQFSTSTELQVKKGATGYNRRSFIQFNLGVAAAPTQSAKLRIYGKLSEPGTSSFTLYPVDNTKWTAAQLNWPTGLLFGPAIGNGSFANSTGKWFEFDVSAYVAARRSQGATSVAFALSTSVESKPHIYFASNEAAANNPTLRIIEGSGPVSPPPPPPPTSPPPTSPPPVGTAVTLRSSADAYVRDGSFAGQNFGTSSTLEVRNSGSAGYSRSSYLSFDLTRVTSVSSAKIRLYGNLVDDRAATGDVRVYSVASAWSETAITWASKPSTIGAALGTITVVGRTAKWYELDVTSWLTSEKAAGKTSVSLGLLAPTVTANAAAFQSDEAAAQRPELVISP
ncbi:CBM96 family carbohydrate-binding protein [Humisphaera borealis]|uniref:DNRLRE domain-containing protein n=1 Tax=Humisphaera borealis TaxID=2807512 RepID=A0A7M2WT18_9BACT|nr:DNRLRE domain-containing protein [Humisphaera borealis]QOV88559.1 DNRLRE domain-containing protein [Humisphaera borealis]